MPDTTDAERSYFAANFQHMPDDWWPESLVIVAKDGDGELGCAILPHHSVENVQQAIKGLRQAFWMHREIARLRETWLKAANG